MLCAPSSTEEVIALFISIAFVGDAVKGTIKSEFTFFETHCDRRLWTRIQTTKLIRFEKRGRQTCHLSPDWANLDGNLNCKHKLKRSLLMIAHKILRFHLMRINDVMYCWCSDTMYCYSELQPLRCFSIFCHGITRIGSSTPCDPGQKQAAQIMDRWPWPCRITK